MFNWIVIYILQYLEQFKFVDLCFTELLKIELFDHLTVHIYQMCLWDNSGDERGCDEGHWHAHTRGLR